MLRDINLSGYQMSIKLDGYKRVIYFPIYKSAPVTIVYAETQWK